MAEHEIITTFDELDEYNFSIYKDQDVVILFRGVHFGKSPTPLNSEEDAAEYRKQIEKLSKPSPGHLMSSAALELAGHDHHTCPDGFSNDVLQKEGETILNIITKLQVNDRCELQEQFSNNYDMFFTKIAEAEINPFNIFKNVTSQSGESKKLTKNPFLSFSDEPRHPVKYALGLKPYHKTRYQSSKILPSTKSVKKQPQIPEDEDEGPEENNKDTTTSSTPEGDNTGSVIDTNTKAVDTKAVDTNTKTFDPNDKAIHQVHEDSAHTINGNIRLGKIQIIILQLTPSEESKNTTIKTSEILQKYQPFNVFEYHGKLGKDSDGNDREGIKVHSSHCNNIVIEREVSIPGYLERKYIFAEIPLEFTVPSKGAQKQCIDDVYDNVLLKLNGFIQKIRAAKAHQCKIQYRFKYSRLTSDKDIKLPFILPADITAAKCQPITKDTLPLLGNLGQLTTSNVVCQYYTQKRTTVAQVKSLFVITSCYIANYHIGTDVIPKYHLEIKELQTNHVSTGPTQLESMILFNNRYMIENALSNPPLPDCIATILYPRQFQVINQNNNELNHHVEEEIEAGPKITFIQPITRYFIKREVDSKGKNKPPAKTLDLITKSTLPYDGSALTLFYGWCANSTCTVLYGKCFSNFKDEKEYEQLKKQIEDCKNSFKEQIPIINAGIPTARISGQRFPDMVTFDSVKTTYFTKDQVSINILKDAYSNQGFEFEDLPSEVD